MNNINIGDRPFIFEHTITPSDAAIRWGDFIGGLGEVSTEITADFTGDPFGLTIITPKRATFLVGNREIVAEMTMTGPFEASVELTAEGARQLIAALREDRRIHMADVLVRMGARQRKGYVRRVTKRNAAVSRIAK